MADAQDETPEVQPEVSSIVAWKAERAARKARAAETVAANAAEAEKAKRKALAKGAVLHPELAKAAKPIEAAINKRVTAKLEAQGKEGLREPAEVKK